MMALSHFSPFWTLDAPLTTQLSAYVNERPKLGGEERNVNVSF
jgi:hypothetical protein